MKNTSNNFPSRGLITTLGGVHLKGTSQYFQVGTVSILVNNAGIVSGTALLDTPDARSLFSEIFKEWHSVHNQDFEDLWGQRAGSLLDDQGAVLNIKIPPKSNSWSQISSQAFLPDMLDQQCGHIVNLASVAGQAGTNKLVIPFLLWDLKTEKRKLFMMVKAWKLLYIEMVHQPILTWRWTIAQASLHV